MKNRKSNVEGMLVDAALRPEQIRRVMQMLENMGFFQAPASKEHHLAYDGGLADHSVNVCMELVRLTEDNGLIWKNKRSPYIVGLCHDLCKVDAYKRVGDTYIKNDEKLLNGHGEKSVILASRIFELTEEEECCIRYHMGAYYQKDWEGFDASIRKYPTTLWTHVADMIASKLIEK